MGARSQVEEVRYYIGDVRLYDIKSLVHIFSLILLPSSHQLTTLDLIILMSGKKTPMDKEAAARIQSHAVSVVLVGGIHGH